MITIKATKRTQQVLVDISKLPEKNKRGIENGLFEAGKEVQRETIRLIKEGPKTGRVYRYKGGQHQASAPGEAPANRSGRLARSVKYNVRNWQEMRVGEEAEYAAYLEKGTRKRIAPRPHLIRAINSKAQETIKAILDSVKREVDR